MEKKKISLNQVWLSLLFSVSISIPYSSASSTSTGSSTHSTKGVILGVILEGSQASYEKQISGLVYEELKNCQGCEVRNFSPYDDKGNWDVTKLPKSLEEAKKAVSFLYLGWNTRMTPEHQPVVDAIKKMTAEGILIVGIAGQANQNTDSAMINRTVLGQSPEIIILGEVNERERLIAHSYYGPEMLTAVRPPRDLMGRGLAPIFFAARLATQWNRRPAQDWTNYLRDTKLKSKRIWPGIDDFFGRSSASRK